MDYRQQNALEKALGTDAEFKNPEHPCMNYTTVKSTDSSEENVKKCQWQVNVNGNVSCSLPHCSGIILGQTLINKTTQTFECEEMIDGVSGIVTKEVTTTKETTFEFNGDVGHLIPTNDPEDKGAIYSGKKPLHGTPDVIPEGIWTSSHDAHDGNHTD